MHGFKKKSDENNKAADLLIENGAFYAPAAQCIYYSCLQHVIHVLVSSLGNEEKTLSSQIHQTGSSHNQYINAIEDDIAQKSSGDLKNFNRSWKKLKRIRVQAAYESTAIERKLLGDCKHHQELIVEVLKRHYQL